MSIEATLVSLFLRHGVKHRMRPDAPISELRTTAARIARLFPAPPRDVELERTTVGGREALWLTAPNAEYRAMRASGYAPERLAIAGDSAGGGLTLATLVALRDADEPPPAAAWVISPWTDLAYRGESIRSNREADAFIRVELIEPTVARYLGSVHPETPLASPLYAALHGLPPTLVHVGSTEILLDDSLRLAERLRDHGTTVDLRVYDDLPHVFHLFAPYVREARAAIRDGGTYLASRMR